MPIGVTINGPWRLDDLHPQPGPRLFIRLYTSQILIGWQFKTLFFALQPSTVKIPYFRVKTYAEFWLEIATFRDLIQLIFERLLLKICNIIMRVLLPCHTPGS